MYNLDDLIHGDRFTEFCDYAILENDSIIDEAEVAKGGLIFVKTDRIDEFFDLVRNNGKKYVIVTHNSDHNIFLGKYLSKPENVLHWFAQNVLVTGSDITPIPIGLERPCLSQSNENLESIIEFSEKELPIINNIYMNFAWQTNPAIRKPLIETYKDIPTVTWQQDRIPFRQYLREMLSHVEVIAPPGNGWDTHRLWETLYLGLRPIHDSYSIDKTHLKMGYWRNLITAKAYDLL